MQFNFKSSVAYLCFQIINETLIVFQMWRINMKRIELVGMPGCGKSTIREILANNLKIQNISYKIMPRNNNIRRIKKLYYLLIFILKNLTFAFYTFKEILKTKNKQLLFQRFISIFYFYEIKQNKSITIFDEGFVHIGVETAISYNFDENLKEKMLIEYSNKILKPDYVFYIKADWKIAKERMLKRKKYMYLKDLPDDEINKYYKQYIKYFEIIIEEMKKNNIQVVEITNNSNLSVLKKNFVEHFNDILFSLY